MSAGTPEAVSRRFTTPRPTLPHHPAALAFDVGATTDRWGRIPLEHQGINPPGFRVEGQVHGSGGHRITIAAAMASDQTRPGRFVHFNDVVITLDKHQQRRKRIDEKINPTNQQMTRKMLGRKLPNRLVSIEDPSTGVIDAHRMPTAFRLIDVHSESAFPVLGFLDDQMAFKLLAVDRMVMGDDSKIESPHLLAD